MKVIRLFLCLFISLFVFGCDEGTEYKYFEVKNESALRQTVYVGDTQASMTVDFRTSDAWTSYVEYSTISGESAQSKSARSTDWVVLEPSSGDKAGDYSVTIKLNPDAGKDISMAMISFVCKGEVLQVMLENSKNVNPGSSDDITNPEKIKAAIEKLELGFWTARNSFYDIDKEYSTSESRKLLNSNSVQLKDMWIDSYSAINTCNLLLEACNYDAIKEQDKEQVMAKAFLYRAMMHFNLASVFGGVPIDVQYPAISEPVRSLLNEVTDLVLKDCEESIHFLSKSGFEFTEACFLRAMSYVFRDGDFDSDMVLDILSSMIESGNIVFEDSNMDGLINQSDSHIGVQTYLFYAYGMSTHQIQKSIQTLNLLAELLNDDTFRIASDSTADDVRQKVVEILSVSWNRGVKYYVNRFMKHEDWGYLNLLPIPMDMMSSNKNFVQNPGWN